MYRVMIVDDEELIVERLRFGINWEKLGYQVCGWANDGQEAWNKIHTLKPDIVISDIRMPVMSGLELVRKIHEEMPYIATVILSGYAEFKYAQEAIRYQVDGYCLKPVAEDELISVLDQIKIKQETTLTQQNQLLETCSNEPNKLSTLLISNGLDLSRPMNIIFGYDFFNQILIKPCFTIKCGKDIRIWIINSDQLPDVEILLQDIIEKNKLSFGVSRQFSADSDLQEAILTAKVASMQWFIDLKPGIKHYTLTRTHDLIAVLNSFDSDIRSADPQKIESALAQLYIQLKSGKYHIRHMLYAYNYILESSDQLTDNYQSYQYEEDLSKNYASINELFSYLRRILCDGLKKNDGNVEIKNVMDYLHMHFTEDISLRSVADEFFINSDYLCKMFRKETGYNFTKYITEIRLEQACALLKSSNLSVSSIAEQSGFNNYFYFAKVFKQNLKITPTEYRVQNQLIAGYDEKKVKGL